MPEDVRDLVGALVVAINARDFEAAAGLMEPDHELCSLLAATDGEVYVGVEGLHAWASAIDETWDAHKVEIAEVHEAGADTAVVVTRNLGVAKLSGVPLDTMRGLVVTHRNGKLVRSVVYPDAAQAFTAAGQLR